MSLEHLETNKSPTLRARAAGSAAWSSRLGTMRLSSGLLLGIFWMAGVPAWPQEPQIDLANQSIEDLMNIRVTSVSKKEQKLSRTAAAIFVITAEDIRHSGATNIPDLLRMAPGVEVAQINANSWAITARGLNQEFASSLLVLVDGRDLYTPTPGGVFWDVLDLPLEAIERIEVIRGPGGTVWGANAVNGVISIITKPAKETHGMAVEAGGGNLDQGFGMARYGGDMGGRTQYRLYTKYFNQVQLQETSGLNAEDGWHVLRGGFRSDTKVSSQDTLTLQGDIYSGTEGSRSLFLPSLTSPGLVYEERRINLSGGFFGAQWEHRYREGSEMSVSFNYNAYARQDVLHERLRSFDLEFRDRLAVGSRQDVVWGVEYHPSLSRSPGELSVFLNPADVNLQRFSVFLQDEIAVVRERLLLTIGMRVERSPFGGVSPLPSARLSYAPTEQQTVWAAVSRPVRTPDEVMTFGQIDIAGIANPNGLPLLVATVGDPQLKNVTALTYELGYRRKVASNFSIDVAGYHTRYENLQTVEPGSAFFQSVPGPPHVVLPLRFESLLSAEAHGLEITGNWQVSARWLLNSSYTFGRIHSEPNPLSKDTSSPGSIAGSDPHVRAQVRSHVELNSRVAWDTSAYFVDRLEFQGTPAYTRVDSGLSWRCSRRLNLRIEGQNLLQDRHQEFIDANNTSPPSEIRRSGYAQLTWRY